MRFVKRQIDMMFIDLLKQFPSLHEQYVQLNCKLNNTFLEQMEARAYYIV